MLVGKKQSTMPKRKGSHVVVRITIGLVLVFAVASAVAIFFEQEARMQRLDERRQELSQRQERVLSQNEELLELKSIMGSDAYIERIARDKLGMIRPDEIVFED